MQKGFQIFVLSLCIHIQVSAQTDSARLPADTSKPLPVYTIHAYEQNRSVLDMPAAVNLISPVDLDAYNNTNMLQAVNTAPGVRMEERSPGSFRFGIRGSALESPFGVRNVKVYYNGIPFTDPSGNTYLNQLGFYNIQSLEIIKGPGSSLYGSGTGGVLLINSMPDVWRQGVSVNYTGGSYGLNNAAAELRIGDSSFQNIVRYQHLQSDGYRQQSAMRNDIISWDAVMKQGAKSELSAHFFYGDLYYQTPGGLTLAEYKADQSKARPGAQQADAAIYQKTFLAGIGYKQQFSTHWSNNTTVYGNYSTQVNPNIRNYSRTSEPNFGARSFFTYETSRERSAFQWITGAEVQQEFAQNKTYQNINGEPQNLQSDQQINNGQVMGFTQLYWHVGNWIFTGSASINRLHVDLTDLSDSPTIHQEKVFSNEVAPRIAVLYHTANDLSVYAVAEKGFSPPTVDELVPTGSATNLGLSPEQGWNYEAGFRGYTLKQRLYFDVNVYYFQLQNSIVQRRDSSGGDYYTNSGGSKQSGVEMYLRYRMSPTTHLINSFAWIGYTGTSYRYDKFIQVSDDFSDKTMPGTPASALSAGFNFASTPGIYLNVNYYYCDRIALNDANTAFSDAYHLLSSRLGYKRKLNHYTFDIFAGANNILDQKYSLGNDLNAINGRYYNAAAPLNFYAGLALGFLK